MYLDINPVKEFLSDLGVSEYYWKFEEEGFDDMESLKDLEINDLKNDLQIHKLAHRKKIIKAINTLK